MKFVHYTANARFGFLGNPATKTMNTFLHFCYVFQRVLFFVVYEAITPELTLEDFPLGMIPPILCHGGLDDAAMAALRVNAGRRQAA